MGSRARTGEAGQEDAAKGALTRVTGRVLENVVIRHLPGQLGAFEAAGGRLVLKGSNTVGICRAFYEYARSHGMGMASWVEGIHFRRRDAWPDSPPTAVTSPFAIRHAYNAVTFAYTFPYWTWERWERELDWQVLHGFNLLMAPVATEAILERVWLRIGLTRAEIDANACGPAHLPFLRMGCITGIDGPLPPSWHAGQIALQHRILARMRELGMEPVIQGFNGFVPRGFTRLHPESRVFETVWNASLPPAHRAILLSPDDPQFAAITRLYLEEWRKEFGEVRHILVDSFNELEIPKTGRPEAEWLADCGRNVWRAIESGQPDGIWVIQGWTFGYKKWSRDNLAALFNAVPDDRMLVLDYANEYANCWGKYQDSRGAFFGKPWVFGYVPNMGGKTAFTGPLDLYAGASAEALGSERRGRLAGFTISGEGLENNEAVYELLADMAWSRDPVDLDDWFERYSRNRYGSCPPAVAESWRILRKGCYGNLKPHPGFRWQHMGQVDRNPNLLTSASLLLSVASDLQTSPLYRADAVERAALALSLKADEWYDLALRSHAEGSTELFEQAAARSLELLTQVDLLMEAHPYHRMDRWIAFARAHGHTDQEETAFESNARKIVTYWAGGVQNYSCRVWGGLVRDYYREWLRREFDALRSGKSFDANAFMLEYVRGSGTSPFTPSADPLADAASWLRQAMTQTLPEIPTGGEVVGRWSPDLVGPQWKVLEWPLSGVDPHSIGAVVFQYTDGHHRLEMRRVALVADGREVAECRHDGYAGTPSLRHIYPLSVPTNAVGNNAWILRAEVRIGGPGTDSRGTVLVRRKNRETR